MAAPRGSSSGGSSSRPVEESTLYGNEIGSSFPPSATTSSLNLAQYPTYALQHVGFGGVLGFCTGYAMKQAAKVAAVMVGATVLLLQGMQFKGWISINWSKIRRDATSVLDFDGDGEFTAHDLLHGFRNTVTVLVRQGPTCAGFGAGIYWGFFRSNGF